MAIQENDILSGRPLVMSFPNNTEFEEGITIFSSDKYFVDVVNDNDVIIIAMRDVEDTVLATFYAYNTDTQTTVTNLTSYTLPNDFGIVTSIDTGSDAYQYITAIMGTPIASDTLDMSTYGQAAKVATNYMTWSAKYGLVISEDATEDPGDMQGGNTRVTSDGMDVYKGQNRVAHFSEEVILGDEESANAYLNPDTFNITNEDGVQFFSVDMDGTQRNVYYYKQHTETISASSSASISINDSPDLDLVPTGNPITVGFQSFGGGFVSRALWTVTKGTASTAQATATAGEVLTLTYDGDHSYTITWNATVQRSCSISVRGYVAVDSPSYTIGTRDNASDNGAFSVAIGEGINASENNQIGLGKYNEGDSNNLLEVGYGTVDEPKNLFAITTTGKLSSVALDSGQITGITVPAGDTTSAQWVDFNHTFPSAPIVVASFYSNPSTTPLNDFGRCGVSVYGVTTTGFYFRVYNNGTVSRSPYVNWIAICT